MVLAAAIVPRLRTRLEKMLPSVCDADPPALANYIIALLERDQPFDELRASCMEKLEEFLDKETKTFVDDLFGFVKAQTDSLNSGSAGAKVIIIPPPSPAGGESKSRSAPTSSAAAAATEEEDQEADEDEDRSFKRRRMKDDGTSAKSKEETISTGAAALAAAGITTAPAPPIAADGATGYKRQR